MNRRRDLSPIFESDLDNNKGHDVPVMITNGLKADGFLKIHRLCMSRKATMTLLSLTSPSRIWLTLRNNITDSLRITEPSAIEPLDPKFVRIDQYVMAPLRNRLYARARIMDVYESVERQEKYVKVFFIDDGLSSWLGAKCLAKMDEEFSFHPWQALGVSLFQVDPINPVNLTTRKEWNDHEIGTLRSIMREYDEFLVNFVHESRLRTDYSDFYKVKIIGLTDEEQNGVSVNELFYLFNPATVSFTRARYDGSKQKMYAPMDGKSLSGKEINDVMDSTERWKRVFPDDWRHPTIYAFTKDDGSRLAWEQQQIPPVTLDWLNEHGYCCEGSYFINIESGYTVSPYEFYGRPLKMKSDNIWMKPESVIQSDILNDMSSNEEDAIITANNELANFGDELHKFYRRKENRHRLQLPELVENLSKSRRIFAMAEIEDEDSMGLGCWRRVEIFCVKKDNKYGEAGCLVRFLDTGGTDYCVFSVLYEIHPIHCQRPPMCLQLCMGGVEPLAGNFTWSREARQFFKTALRQDVPVSVKLQEFNSSQPSMPFHPRTPTYFHPNVFLATNVKVLDGSESTIQTLMVEKYKLARSASFELPPVFMGFL